MANTGSGGVKTDAMRHRERFNGAIFFQVGFFLILNVMIEGKDKLLGRVNLFGSNCLEFAHHRRRVVVGHYIIGTDGDKISRAQGPVWTFGEMSLCDFLNDGLWHT